MTEIQSRSTDDSAFPHYMRRAEAARYIRMTYGIPCVAPTLAKYACTGAGPAFRKADLLPPRSRCLGESTPRPACALH